MIKLESIHTEEVRGIRNLDLNFRKEKFAICGPNGSGKSGIIDAIEFGLTGQMGRLSGRGTKGLSVASHGPHVDKTKFPDAAFVELTLFLTDLKKSVRLRRIVSSPKKVTIDPDEPAIRAVIDEIADHPEITLSRRDILRFILVEPAKRSEEIQALLKLDMLGDARRALLSALNTLIRSHGASTNHVKASRAAFLLHLQLPAIKTDDILEVVNQRRKLLDLALLTELTKETNLADGLENVGTLAGFNKVSALRDIKGLSEAHEKSGEAAKMEVDAILRDLKLLDEDPTMLAALQRREFVEKGLGLVDTAECLLCDSPWPDIEHLKEHLRAKLTKSKEAKTLRDRLLANVVIVTGKLIQFSAYLQPIATLAEAVGEKEFGQEVASWRNDLEGFTANLATVEKIRKLKGRFEAGWLKAPAAFADSLDRLNDKIKAKPDQSATIDAQTFLTTAQLRLTDFRKVRKDNEAIAAAKEAAKIAYDTYCSVLEEELNALYDEVQQDFSAYYRALNGTDEAGFTAKLIPAAGSLGLDVNFYDRGLFPPGAYHSEGHQDGMGVCLYLALMKRLFQKRFTLSLMDDVVMSVDTGHRYEFCKLLKTEFPATQFIITTHDKVWASQMKSSGLVSGKTMTNFYGWTIDTGPLVQSQEEIWDEIAASLAKRRIDLAAFALRHHLEYTMRALADELGARPQFRSDGNYELDDMLTSVLTRMKRLWGDAAKSAESWGNANAQQIAIEKKQFLSTCDAVMRSEQWAVNKLVHYNAWANLEKADFLPVVSAFKELLENFRCAKCDCWIYVLTKHDPQTLRCDCTVINFNLIAKQKND